MSERSVSRRELFWYAAGSVPGGIGVLAWNYLVFYYNQVLGISGLMIGLGALFVSLFDAVTDLAVGSASDRTRSRWGRRHPYLFLAAVPSAMTFYLMFWVPAGLSGSGLLVWLLALHLFKRVVDTCYSVPYLALGAEISRGHEERTRIATWRAVFFNIGRSTAGALLLLVFLRPTEAYPDGQLNPAGYVDFAAWMSVVIAVHLLLSAWQTRKWSSQLAASAQGAVGSLREMGADLRGVMRHRPFRSVLFGSISRHMAWGMSDALGIFMMTFFWRIDTEVMFLWGVGMFSGMFAGLPFWRWVAGRIDKRAVAILGDVTYLFFFCVPYLLRIAGCWPEEGSAAYVPLYVLTTGLLAHFGIAASGPMVGSMLGDVTDYDELETGQRREGVIFAAESFSWKALTGLGPLLAGLVIDWVGISDASDPAGVPDATVTALGLAQGGVMFVFFVFAIFFISRYDLGRARHAAVLAALESRAAEGGAR